MCGKKQNLLERVRREKKSAEKELERVRDSASSEATRARESLEQLQNRVHEAERVKEEAHRQIDAALMAKQAAEAWCVNVHTLCEYYTYIETPCNTTQHTTKHSRNHNHMCRHTEKYCNYVGHPSE